MEKQLLLNNSSVVERKKKLFFSLCCAEVLSVLSQPQCLLLEEGRKKIPDAFVRWHHTSQKVCTYGLLSA